MRKGMVFILAAVLVLSSLALVGCGSPEQTLISRYIQAVNMNDKDTLTKITPNPVAVPLTKWKIVEKTQPVEKKVSLEELKKKVIDAKKKMDELQQNAALAKLDFDDFAKKYEKWSRAMKRRNKKKYEDLKSKYEDLRNQFLAARDEYNKVLEEFNFEKKLQALSVGDIPQLEKMSGKAYEEEIVIQGTDKKGNVRKFKFYLVRYELTKPGATQPIRGRWVVRKIEEIVSAKEGTEAEEKAETPEQEAKEKMEKTEGKEAPSAEAKEKTEEPKEEPVETPQKEKK